MHMLHFVVPKIVYYDVTSENIWAVPWTFLYRRVPLKLHLNIYYITPFDTSYYMIHIW